MAADILLRVGQFFDRLVAVRDPHQALSRHRARQLLARAYEGASKRDGWSPRRAGASANADHLADATTLRVRSRALVQNVPYIAQGLRSLVANVIGTGITPRWLGLEADTYDTLWKQWSTVCDADGRLDIYGIQAAAYRAMEQDGEVLLRLRPRRLEDDLPVPLQLQLLEIDWLDSSRSMANGPNQILNGIEYDPLGKVVGYWLFDQHPGETNVRPRGRATSHFVPAASIIHLYTPDRPGQGRGFPRLAPVIARVRDLQLYEDAELQRKNLETRLGVIASGDVEQMANPPAPGEAVDTSAAKAGDLGPLQSGSIMKIPGGATSLTVLEPKVAAGYVEYVKYQLHLIAAGFGVTYEMMTGDVSDTNFSSARVRLQDFRREAEFTQWNIFIPKFCDRICRAFVDAAVLAGKVQRRNYGVEYSTPKWDYVNPEQEVKADLAEIAGGLSSFSEKLRRRGYKPDLVFEELRQDIQKLKDMQILDVMLQLLKGKALEEGGQPAAGKAPAKS
jgi:lambda family phage portal protein